MKPEKLEKSSKTSKPFEEFYKGVSNEEKTRKTEKKWSLYFILFVSGIWSIIASVVLWIMYFQSEFQTFFRLTTGLVNIVADQYSGLIKYKLYSCKYFKYSQKQNVKLFSKLVSKKACRPGVCGENFLCTELPEGGFKCDCIYGFEVDAVLVFTFTR